MSVTAHRGLNTEDEQGDRMSFRLGVDKTRTLNHHEMDAV